MSYNRAQELVIAVQQDAKKRKAKKQKGNEKSTVVTSTSEELLTYVQTQISASQEYGHTLYNALVNKEANEQLKNIIVTLLQKHNPPVQPDEIDIVKERIYEDMAGLGFLRKYLDDPKIEEINIFGAGKGKVELVKGGANIMLQDENFPTPENVIDISRKMVRMGGETIDLSNPRVDSYMGGGTRISAMIAPIIREDQGAVVSIRKQTASNIMRADLVRSKTAMEDEFELIELLTRNNISGALVGATGCGKTTVLNYLLADYFKAIGDDARFFIIEESRELQLPAAAKAIYTAAVGGPKPVTASDLTKSALRFHPTFICCAEMRGEEAMNALTSAQTGHIVWSSFHADNCEDAYSRFLTMCKMSGTDLSEHLLMKSLVKAFPIMISAKQLKDRSRKITGIFEATGVNGAEVVGHYLYKLHISSMDKDENDKVTKVRGAHVRVGDLSDNMAQRIYDNCGDFKTVSKFARPGWEPEKIEDMTGTDSRYTHEDF